MPLAAFPKCFLDDLCVHCSMTAEQWIDLAADQLDVDGLEFYWGFTPHDNPLRLAQLRQRMTARSLVMPMMCYSPDFIQVDPPRRAQQVEGQKRAIEATAALGGSLCRVLSGQRRPGVSRADGLRMAADSIAACLPDAERYGIILVLENHYKDGYWEYPEFAQKTDVFLALLDAIPTSPWFGVNFDPSNALIAGEDPIALLEAIKSRVVSMHASDRYLENGTLEDLHKHEAHPQQGYSSILKHGIIGRGLIDYDQIFATLKSVGFTGWISIEDGQDPASGMEHLQLSAEFLRAKMRAYGLQ